MPSNNDARKRYICVGKERLYDGTISSVKLIQRVDPEQRIRKFSSEYIRVALMNEEMEIDSIKLSEDGSSLIFIDKSEKHVKLEDDFVDIDELEHPNDKNRKPKVHRHRKKYKHKK